MFRIGILKETLPTERRVAMIPNVVSHWVKAGHEVLVERSAGAAAGFGDADYESVGAQLKSRDETFQADVLLQVRGVGAADQEGRDDLGRFQSRHTLIAMCDPLNAPKAIQPFAETGARLFALELMPRITRAQSMDVLSSMATVAGYRAVLLAAIELPKMFPLMMTAAGTLTPAKVFVIGAGVAGLQAIATARRLGAVVQAYDVRPAVRDQIESLGGRFVELPISAEKSEDQGGYARQMDEDFYQRQRELMARVVAENDVVICTAAIPGKQSPLLVTASAVRGMRPGSVIVDLAAERGGNCECSAPDERVVEQGVTILGPTNLASDVPMHASQMLSKNIDNFLRQLTPDNQLQINCEDEIVSETMVAEHGEIVHPRIREILGIDQQKKPQAPDG